MAAAGRARATAPARRGRTPAPVLLGRLIPLEAPLLGFGLLAALAWGIADFGGAVASRRVPAPAVVLGSQLIAGVFAAAVAVIWGEQFPGTTDIALSAGAGVATAIALAAFYRGLATARVGVVAPVAAVLGAGLPVIVGIGLAGAPAPLQLAGMAMGLAGVGLVSRSSADGIADRPSGLGIALLAGVAFGAFFVFLGLLEGTAVFWPLAVARLTAVAAIGVAARMRGTQALPPRSSLPLVAGIGLLDTLGMAGFVLATQIARLDEAAIISSMYPVVTIVLAAAIFRERIGRIQAIGIALAMAAIVLIGSG
jgi:drug/metabolite transporter (DMT)-like permease